MAAAFIAIGLKPWPVNRAGFEGYAPSIYGLHLLKVCGDYWYLLALVTLCLP